MEEQEERERQLEKVHPLNVLMSKNCIINNYF